MRELIARESLCVCFMVDFVAIGDVGKVSEGFSIQFLHFIVEGKYRCLLLLMLLTLLL